MAAAAAALNDDCKLGRCAALREAYEESADSDDKLRRREALREASAYSSDDHDGLRRRMALREAFVESSDEDDDDPLLRAVLLEAFGDSSDSDHDSPIPQMGHGAGGEHWRWEAVAGVRGLWLCAAFLSADEQSSLLAAIQREGWFSDEHNQAMKFGDLPSWAIELSELVREAVCVGAVNDGVGRELTHDDELYCPLPSDLLWREPLFDQLIANRYKPGEGICAHVDLLRFDDGIAIVSLESACVMRFSRQESRSTACDTLKQEECEPANVAVYLNPGSLVLMSGDARYLWKHEINRKPGAQLWDGRELEQHRRTSVTFRKLRASLN